MSVEKTRAEILRLIAKVNEAPATPAKAGHRGAVERRRQQLDKLREQRDRLATTLARTPLADRVGRIEQRLDRIETRLGSGGGGGGAARQPAGTSSVPADAVFGGMIRETMLGDMLQLVTSQGMSGVFGVSDGDREIMLYFREGEIHHADGGGTEGEDAVFAAMAIQVGRYYFRETTDLPDDRTINANTQFLILEALRRIDEESAGATP